MAKGAPKGNVYWRLRATHGAPHAFKSPEDLWERAVEYFEWASATPLDSVEFFGKDAKKCIVPKLRAFSQNAFCLYAGVNHSYLNEFKSRELKKAKRSPFLEVIQRIEQVIYVQKFEGAAAGLLNSTLITREMGMADKLEQKVESTVSATVSGKVGVTVRSAGVPFANKDSEVDVSR